MKVIDLPTESIVSAEWNSNTITPEMLSRLRQSIQRFDLVVPLVVRSTPDSSFETIGGAQRVGVLREMASEKCLVFWFKLTIPTPGY